MPRLPTILVIGSQAISTMPVSSAVVMCSYLSLSPGSWSPGLLEARQELVPLLAPLGLFVGRLRRKAAQRADDGAVHAAGRRRNPGAWRLVHEGHELVGESPHCARD